VGECVDCAGWRFEVLDLDGKRIDKVLASRQLPESEGCSADLDRA
jgi:putative hemolysin